MTNIFANGIAPDFDIAYTSCLNKLVVELSTILPGRSQYSITVNGPAGGNYMVVVYYATADEATLLREWLVKNDLWTDNF